MRFFNALTEMAVKEGNFQAAEQANRLALTVRDCIYGEQKLTKKHLEAIVGLIQILSSSCPTEMREDLRRLQAKALLLMNTAS